MKRRVIACLLVIAFVLGAFVPAISPTPVLAITAYGADAYAGGEPIGGGTGYSSYYSAVGAYAVCTTEGQLTTALAGAGSGDVIWIPNGTTITITGSYSKTLKSGAILASDRGLLGVAGGKVKWTYEATSYMTPLFYAESGAIFSGLTLEGPQALADMSGPRNCAIRASAKARVEIENCEIYNFPEAGVWFGDYGGAISAWDSDNPVTGRHWIHHSYIHGIQKHGFGYGIGEQSSVSSTGNSFLAEANILGPCRHSIMAQAGPNSYEIRYNIFYDSYYNTNETGTGTWYNATQIDCHGTGTTASPSAGIHLIIHHNTFSANLSYSTKPNVGIRGIPLVECNVYYNWTQKTTHTGLFTETASTNSAFTLQSSSGGTWSGGALLATYNMTVYDNWYGTSAPPDVGAPTYHVVTLSTLDPSNLLGDLAVLNGSVTGEFDTQTVDNTTFVWDLVSQADPGNTDPSVSTYTNYWSDNTPYNDNLTLSHHVDNLTEGSTYYFRFGVCWSTGTWEYGDELSFLVADTGCDIQYLLTSGADSESEIIGSDNMSFNSILATDNEDINYVYLRVYRVGSPTLLHVYLYNENTTTFVPEGAALSEGDFDVSAITTDNIGEWISIPLDTVVTVTAGLYYDLVVTQDEPAPDYVVWITTTTDGPGYYAHSHDTGATWLYGPVTRDGLYELRDCDITAPVSVEYLHIISIQPTEITLAWQETTDASPYFRIVYKTTGFPTDPFDGTLVDVVSIASVTADDLEPGTTYYFGVWGYYDGLYSLDGTTVVATTSAGYDSPSYGSAIPTSLNSTILDDSPIGSAIDFISTYADLPSGTVGILGYGAIIIFLLVGVACYTRSTLLIVGLSLVGLLLGFELGVFSFVLLVIAALIGFAIGMLRGGQPTGG